MMIVAKLFTDLSMKLFSQPSLPEVKPETILREVTKEDEQALTKVKEELKQLYVKVPHREFYSLAKTEFTHRSGVKNQFSSLIDPEYFDEKRRLFNRQTQDSLTEVMKFLPKDGSPLKRPLISDVKLNEMRDRVNTIRNNVTELEQLNIEGEMILAKLMCDEKSTIGIYLHYNEFDKKWVKLDPDKAYRKQLSETCVPAYTYDARPNRPFFVCGERPYYTVDHSKCIMLQNEVLGIRPGPR